MPATYYIHIGLQWKVRDHTTLQCSSSFCFHPPCSKPLNWIGVHSISFSLTFSKSTYQRFRSLNVHFPQRPCFCGTCMLSMVKIHRTVLEISCRNRFSDLFWQCMTLSFNLLTTRSIVSCPCPVDHLRQVASVRFQNIVITRLITDEQTGERIDMQTDVYVGKPSAVGQPTRPTQPFILSG